MESSTAPPIRSRSTAFRPTDELDALSSPASPAATGDSLSALPKAEEHPGPAPASPPPHFLAGLHEAPGAPSIARGRQKLVEDAVRRAQARQLAERSQSAERLTLALAAALSVGLLGIFPVHIVVPWMSLVGLAVGARAWVRVRLRSQGASPDRFLREFRLALIPVGCAWAAGPLAMAGTMDSTQMAVSLVLFAGVTGASTASLAPDRGAMAAFVTSVTVPAGIAIALGGWTATNRLFVAVTALFAVTMIIVARHSGEALAQSVRTREALRTAERAQRSERSLLDALINSAPTAIVATDSAGTILGANPAFEALFGWSSSDALDKNLDRLIVPSELEEEGKALFRSVAKGEIVTKDVVRLHRDGTTVHVRASAARAHDSGVDAVFIMYEDRSAEVETYAALQQAEAHYRDLVESSLDLVWTVDVSGRWTFLNAAADDIYGAPPGELIGTAFGDRVVDDRRSTDLAALTSVFEGHALTDYESVHRAIDGTERRLSFNGGPIRDASGTIIGAQGTARDVSERAAVREALEEARELALHHANDKTAFLANMSHEIRTPMNAVIGMIEILLTSNLTKEQRRNGEVIRSSAGALLTLIDGILDFTKLESGNVQLEEIPYSVRGLVESTTRLLAVQAQKKGLKLSYDVDSNVPDRAMGDPGRIRQILTNLVGNAIKFTHEGSVSVRVGAVAGEGSDSPERLAFFVADTGIGVPPEKLSTIFNHFTQADPSTTRRYGGTGLGLAICKGFVEAMGGDLAVDSTLGHGSEFSFWIPFRPAPAVSAASLSTPRFAGTRALVIEADPEDRADLEALLLPLGVSLTPVEHAQAALEQLAASADDPFDLVLMDRAVSGMDGFELAGRLAETEGHLDVPVVMLSSEPQIGEGALCRTMGIDGYLPKPVNRGDLLEIIGRVLFREESADTQDALVTRHSIAEARQSLHILLVEDNPLNQEVASALLQRRGHTIDVVDCGTDAVTAVAAADYDLVLMDIQLPGIDGVEATRRIRATPVGAELPIVALTAHAFGEEQDRAFEAGMNDFLTKPFRPHELFAVVEGWLPAIPQDSSRSPGVGSHGPETTEPPVDVEAFRAEMREVGIESVVDESLALFQQTAAKRIDDMVAAHAASDWETVGREAHGLKSAAGTIRAHRLHTLLDQIEDAANDQAIEQLTELVPSAREACTAALRFLDSLGAGEPI